MVRRQVRSGERHFPGLGSSYPPRLPISVVACTFSQRWRLGDELWSSNGTVAGVPCSKQTSNPGAASSSRAHRVAVRTAYPRGSGDTIGRELFSQVPPRSELVTSWRKGTAKQRKPGFANKQLDAALASLVFGGTRGEEKNG